MTAEESGEMKLVQFLLVLTSPVFVSCSSMNLDSASRFPGQLQQGNIGKLPAATNPYRAHEQRVMQWQNENGEIPADALVKALKQRARNIVASSRLHSESGDPNQMLGTQSFDWIQRGPANIGGRTRALAIDPRDTNRMWAGGVSGGLWFSSDGGQSWSVVDDWWVSLAVGCIAMDPTNPDVMYVGTGEGFFNGDAIGGAGIFKTIDGGATWTQIPSTANWDNVCRIAISRQDPNHLLASRRYGGIYLSYNGGNSWSSRYWVQGSYDIDFNPNDDQFAVAHIIDYDFGTNEWFHQATYSTNGGTTWWTASGLDRLPGFGSRIEVAYAPSSPNIVYASVATDGGAIWKSTDGGQSYTKQTTSGNSGSNWYANPLWVDPTDPDVLVTGGGHIFRSMDGGKTLAQISSGYINTEQAHPDIHNFFNDPNYNGTSNRRVWVVTDGGMYVADDIYTVSTSSGWSRKEQEYRTTQYYGAVGDGPSGLIIGGLQDNGTLRLEEGNENAHLTFGGDGGFCAIDRTSPNFTYGEYIFLEIHRSTNGGQTASYIYSGIDDAGTDANFIAPFILDPNNPNRMWAGGRSLWRSEDLRGFRPHWQRVAGPNTDHISAIDSFDGDSNVVWYGLNNGEVWMSTNATDAQPTWAAVDDNGAISPLPDRYVTRILIDPENSNIVYAAFGGFSADNLYRSDDGGLTWSDITGDLPTGLPEAPVRGIARHPDDPNRLYVGTQVGIFESADGGTTWSTNNYGPASVSVDEVNFMHNSRTLLAATHGRGIFTRNVGASCLDLSVADLSGNSIASFDIQNGTPGQKVAVLWATRPGSLDLNNIGGWCVNFGLKIPPAEASQHIVAQGKFDAAGRYTGFRAIPGNLTGTRVLLQAGQHGTCPDVCMSNILNEVIH